MNSTLLDKKANRNHGIDLLRIVSMLMIVVLHVLGRGGILSACTRGSTNYYVAWFLEIGCYCAVNCYALISGYVGINSKPKFSSLATIWCQVAFYSLGIALLFFFFSPGAVEAQNLIKYALPVTTGRYWYFTAYFLMYLLAPFINTAVNNMSKRSLVTGLTILFFVFIPLGMLPDDHSSLKDGYSFVWLSMLYALGAFIKKYGFFEKAKKRTWLAVYFASILGSFGSAVVLGKLLPKYEFVFVNYISPSIFLAGLSLFMFFSKCSVSAPAKKLVAFFAPVSFGVYLIHTHLIFFGQVLKGLFASFAQMAPWLLVLCVAGAAAAIYLGCSLLDWVRKLLFDLLHVKIGMVALENIFSKLQDKLFGKESNT